MHPTIRPSLSIILSIHPSIIPSNICLPIQHPSTHSSIIHHLFIHLSIYHTSIHPFIHWSICLFPIIHLSFIHSSILSSFVHPCIYHLPSTHSSIYPSSSIHPPICPPIHPLSIICSPMHACVHPCICLSYIYWSIRLSIFYPSSIHPLSIHASIHPSTGYRNFKGLCCWSLAYPSFPIHEASDSKVQPLPPPWNHPCLRPRPPLGPGVSFAYNTHYTVLPLSFYLCVLVFADKWILGNSSMGENGICSVSFDNSVKKYEPTKQSLDWPPWFERARAIVYKTIRL